MAMTETGAENPVTALRRAAGGMTRAELARKAGIPYTELVRAEKGYSGRLPARVRDVLVAAGVDEPEVAYQRWREAQMGGLSALKMGSE